MKIKNKLFKILSLSLLGFSVLFGVSALLNYSSDNKVQVHAATEDINTAEIEVFNVVIDTDKLSAPYPDAILYKKDRYVISTNDYPDYISHNDSYNNTALVYGDEPLSEWDWSGNPLDTYSKNGDFILSDGVYAGYFATFQTSNYREEWHHFTAETEVNVVDKNGDPVDGVYTIFYEYQDMKYIVVVYDLGQCKRVDVTSVDFTVYNAEALNTYTKLYPGDSYYSIGLNTNTATSLFYLTDSSANQEELIDYINCDFMGYYSTSDDPSTITSMISWSEYENTYFAAGEKLALVYKYYLYDYSHLVDTKYDFNDEMTVNLLDENGEPFEGVSAYAYPYYWDGTRYGHYFYLVVYADEVQYAGVVDELNFDTASDIEWPEKLNPGATLKESFPDIAEKYYYGNYTVITSSNSEVKKIHQDPGSSAFNVNNVDAYLGIGYLYSESSYGRNIYSVYSASEFESSYRTLQNDTEYIFGFVIQLEPGYILDSDVKIEGDYEIQYSLVDELNYGDPGSYYGYGRYGSSQYYFVVYTIGTAEYNKVTQLGVSFNESLLSNVSLENGAYHNQFGNYQLPNYEFVTFGNKEGYKTNYDDFLDYVNENYGGSVDAYWEYYNEYYLENYGTEYPDELKYVSNGFWIEKTDNGWEEPELQYNYNTGNYEFALIAGKTYGFAYSIHTKDGYVFDGQSISQELNNLGFEVLSLNDEYITFVYEVGSVNEKVIDHIEFEYAEEFEIDQSEIITGAEIPEYYDYSSGAGLITLPEEYYSMLDYFDLSVVYSNDSSFDCNSYNNGWAYPGEKFAHDKYFYMVAYIALRQGYVFSQSVTHNLVEQGYEIDFYSYEGETDYHYVIISKKIGYAIGTPISSSSISADDAYQPIIGSPVSSISLDSITLTPSDKIEIDYNEGIYYKSNPSDYSYYSCSSTATFAADYHYYHIFYISTKEGYGFASNFELKNLPEGSVYTLQPGGVKIKVEYYLGQAGYGFIDEVDVTVSQEFIDAYLAFESFTYQDLYESVIINDQNAKYVAGAADLLYFNPSTNELEFAYLEEPLSAAYTYYFAVYLITGEETGIEDLYCYRFSQNTTNKASECLVKPVWGDDNGNLLVVQLIMELPTLSSEDFTEAEITLGESLTYNAQIQTQEIVVTYQNETLVEGLHYVVSGHENKNAGTYTMTVTGVGVFKGTKTIQYTILKATHDMSRISFEDVTVTYDGEEHEVELDGTLPVGVTVSYTTNKGTNAGTYNAVATFTYDTANYNVIENKTATLTINKATHDMSGITFEDVTVTYDGQEHEVELDGTLPTGVTVSVTSNKGTNAGTYNAVATFAYDTVNYNAIADMTATLTINKATHNMSGITFNNVTVTYDGKEHEVVLDGTLPAGVTVSYTSNKGTNAGTYNAVATFAYDTVNYNAIADMTAKLTINKATHNMSGISFNDVTVTYDGKEHVVEITGTLPNGVTVAYENNKATNAGVYNAVAKFAYDTVNYNAISSMEATLVIKQVELKNESDLEEGRENDVIVSAPEGIDPTKELFVELVELEETDKDLSAFLEKGERVAVAYDVKLLKDGAEVQPDGTLKIKILIPQELRNRNFNIMHIHNDTEKTILEYQIEGDYVVVETDKLSEFAFVYETGSILWLVIVLGVLALLEGGLLVYLILKDKQYKASKLIAVYPPFIFGMFIPAWQIIMVVILIIVVAALAVVDVLYALKLLKGREANKEVVESNEPVVEEKEDEDEEVIKLWDEQSHSYTIIRLTKGFEARLRQSNDEIKGYYDSVKNELLSYTKVKSKISFKHEAFKFGKDCIARLKFRGKTLCLYLSLDPKVYENTKYKVEDMSEISTSSEVPTMYRINLPRREVYAKELIKDLMEKVGVTKQEKEFVNYSNEYQYEDNDALLEKGLIKKSVKVVGEGPSIKTLINPVNISKKEPQQ